MVPHASERRNVSVAEDGFTPPAMMKMATTMTAMPAT
jgi:hypothetical protein